MSRYFGGPKSKKRSRFFMGSVAAAAPDEEQAVDGSPCAACGQGTMRPRDGRYGPFLGCSTFPACRHTVHLGRERASETRRTARAAVRLEVESEATVRCWSTDGAAEQQEALRRALARVTVSSCSGTPRADWAAATAQARATAVFRLEDHEEVLKQLTVQLAAADEAVAGSSSGGTSTSPPLIRAVPASTLRFLRERPTSAEHAAASAALVSDGFARMPARLRRRVPLHRHLSAALCTAPHRSA